MQKCTGCGQEKEDSEFHLKSNDKRRCRQCKRERNKKWSDGKRSEINQRQNQWRQDNLEHSRAYHRKWASAPERKKEQSERGKKWYLENKDHHTRTARASDLKKFWPELTPEERLIKYDNMAELQENRCGICSRHRSEFKMALSVDHCHKTGKVRGLLCGNCNRGLGLFYENAKIILIAASYVVKHESSAPQDS